MHTTTQTQPSPIDLRAEQKAFDIHYEDFQRAGTDNGWTGVAWAAWITARATQATPAATHTASLASASIDSVYLGNAATLLYHATQELKRAARQGYTPATPGLDTLLNETSLHFRKILAKNPCPTCSGHGMLGQFPFGTKCHDCAKPRSLGEVSR